MLRWFARLSHASLASLALVFGLACSAATPEAQPQVTDAIATPGTLAPVACASPEGQFRGGLSAPGAQSQLGFEDVSARLGTLGRSAGVSLVDVDDDGWLDVTLTGEKGVELYRGLGGGSFENVSSRWGISRLTLVSAMGITWADVDGDGRLDLYLTGYSEADELVMWDGQQYQRVGEAWGLPQEARWTSTASFGDLDGDGDLDVYLATGTNARDRSGQPDPDQGERDLVYRNDGDHFTEVAYEFGLAGPDHGSTFVGLIADLNNDGAQDVMAIHDFRPDELYLGDGKGHFTRASETWLPAQASSLMGLDLADVDGDGLLDLYATNFGPDVLYRQQAGVPHFSDAGDWLEGPDPTDPVVSWGCALADLDNDGDYDAVTIAATDPYARRGDGATAILGRLVALENHGGFLADASDRLGPAFEWTLNGHGLARGDFDRDGRVDLLVGGEDNKELPDGVRTAPLLLRNVSEPLRPSLSLTLRQPSGANRFAVGARVDVITRDADGVGRSQSRVVLAGSSYLSAVSYALDFGLGAARVEVVRVTWPDGSSECLMGVDSGRWDVTRGVGARRL